MKKVTFIILLNYLLISSSVANDLLEREGDLLQEDGFSIVAWEKYHEAVLLVDDFKERSRLINKLIRTAIAAKKEKETLSLIEKHLDKFSKEINLTMRAELALKISYLQINLKEFKNAVATCLALHKSFADLEESPRTGLIQTIVYAYIANGQSEEASKYIEENISLVAELTVKELELLNVRLKINSGKYVGAIATLEKYTTSEDILPQFLNMWAYLNSGNTDKSLEIYQKFKIKIDSLQSSVSLTPLTAEQEQIKIILKDQDLPTVLIKLAESLEIEKTSEAIGLFNDIAKWVKDSAILEEVERRKIERYIQANKVIEAIEELKIYLRDYPNSNKIELAKFQLAELYFDSKSRNSGKSLETLEQLLEKTLADTKLHYRALVLRAMVKDDLGNLSAAASDYLLASEVAKTKQMGAYFVVFSLFKAASIKYEEGDKTGEKGRYLESADLYNKAAQLESILAEEAMLMQIQALRKGREINLANKATRQWLRVYPKNKDLIYFAALIHFETGNFEDGLKSMNQFISTSRDDSRVPMLFVYALKTGIYSPTNNRYTKELNELLSHYDEFVSHGVKDKQLLGQSSPFILHLKAIYGVKKENGKSAQKMWEEFIQKYPTHPSLPEVYLWLGYQGLTSTQEGYKNSLDNYKASAILSGENKLKIFTNKEIGKLFYKINQFEQAASSVEMAIKTLNNLPEIENRPNELVNLLFLAGDIYCRSGNFSDKAVPKFTEALALNPSPEIALALHGRIADCYLAAAYSSLNNEKNEEFEKHISQAVEIYQKILEDKNLTQMLRDQTSYKLAKCYEAKIKPAEMVTGNISVAKALEVYQKLFFDFYYDKNKASRDHYFFCRAGYDLARLQMNSGDINSAISSYENLASTNFPGTMAAKELAKYLKEKVEAQLKENEREK